MAGMLPGMTDYFGPGRTIWHRVSVGSALCQVNPVRVSRHDADGLVTWIAGLVVGGGGGRPDRGERVRSLAPRPSTVRGVTSIPICPGAVPDRPSGDLHRPPALPLTGR